MTIPFVDLRRLHDPLRAELLTAFERVLQSGSYVQSREVAALEQAFATQLDASHALAVSNGTAALHLALLACGIGPGDEVITVANTFFATAEAITAVGATPVFADIQADGFNIDLGEVERLVTPRTRAVVVVHLYGEMADMDGVMNLARRHGLRVIEDACQAHGAVSKGRFAGTIGDAGCFSFYPTKNLGTVGEGGMVVTNDPHIAASVARLRDHGQDEKHHHVDPAFNYRMAELQAAALRVFLPHLAAWNEGRVAAAGQYRLALAGTSVRVPDGAGGRHVYHLFVVRTADRDALKAWLADRGIATAVHYPVPIHLQPAYAHLGYGRGSLPRTEATTNEILSLPFHPLITPDEIAEVASAIRAFDAVRAMSEPAQAVAAR